MLGKKKEIVVKVDGMHCEHCAARVTSVLEALGCRAHVSLAEGKAKIRCPESVSTEAILDAIRSAGFDPSL